MDVAYIPVGQLAEFVPALLPHLKTSAKWSRGRSTPDDILRFLLTGQMQLWAVHEDGKVQGHIVTEIKTYPQLKMLVVQYCAMEPNSMASVEDRMQEVAEDVAKKSGCAGIEFIGRPGWRKTANKYGYDVQSVVYQRFF